MNSEVEELKRKVESLETVLKSIAEHAAAISKRLERWERDGMPNERLFGFEDIANSVG